MSLIEEKFSKLGVENAPGQEVRQRNNNLKITGANIQGDYVDFSHGDVNAFVPTPEAFEVYSEGYKIGAAQAYTEYRGDKSIRQFVADKLAQFSGAPVDADKELILTPGTQGALFLVMGSVVTKGTKVAIIEPDYFANRKLAEFFEGQIYPIHMDYMQGEKDGKAGLNLQELATALKTGVEVLLFSNPNNPTGAIYSKTEIEQIAELANKYNVTVIDDELYSRQIFDKRAYTHMRALPNAPKNLITIMGPSKTESLSGFRLGVAYGTAYLIDRMEKLQAIATLRAPGYSQRVFYTWFAEPDGFIEQRIMQHQAIRDDIVKIFNQVSGVSCRPTEGGSYLFICLPELTVDIQTFVKILKIQANVVVTPGTEFGPQFTHHFRINFSQDHDKAVNAVRRVMQVLEYYRA